MKYLKTLSRGARLLFLATASFLLFGYLCRLLNIYFFWESKSIGWICFWLFIILALLGSIKSKRLRLQNVILEKIGIGLSVFILLLKGIFWLAVPHSAAYERAIEIVKADRTIGARIGPVNGIFLVPFGGIAVHSDSQGSAGEAEFYFVVKGSKGYCDLDMQMVKYVDTDWQVAVE